jgi:hypothetical protein
VYRLRNRKGGQGPQGLWSHTETSNELRVQFSWDHFRLYSTTGLIKRRSQRARGLRHELYSLAGSNPTEGMDIYVFILCLRR